MQNRRPFDVIMDEWKLAHDEITRLWIEQGKPDEIIAWGELLSFEEVHDRLSQECNAELHDSGYLEAIDKDDPPEWGTPGFVNTHKASEIVSAVKDAKRQQAG